MSNTNIMLEAFMQLSTAKHEVYSKNVANANQPGQLAQEIASPTNFAELIRSVSGSTQLHLAVTSNNHIGGSKPKMKFKTIVDPEGGELKPNGNNISLAEQARKTAKNQLLYDTAIRAYKGSAGLVKIVNGKAK